MRKNKKQFSVQINVPGRVRISEVKEYILTAIYMWAKGGDPRNPLFDLSAKDIQVKLSTIIKSRNKLTEERDRSISLLTRAYKSFMREGWEKGESCDEVLTDIKLFLDEWMGRLRKKNT